MSEGKDSVNLKPETVDRLKARGYIVGPLPQDELPRAGREGHGLSATDLVTGVDAICDVLRGLLRLLLRAARDREATWAQLTHGLFLFAGALGLVSVASIRDKYLLLLSMTGVGIA